jgi:hypothetical protein
MDVTKTSLTDVTKEQITDLAVRTYMRVLSAKAFTRSATDAARMYEDRWAPRDAYGRQSPSLFHKQGCGRPDGQRADGGWRVDQYVANQSGQLPVRTICRLGNRRPKRRRDDRHHPCADDITPMAARAESAQETRRRWKALGIDDTAVDRLVTSRKAVDNGGSMSAPLLQQLADSIVDVIVKPTMQQIRDLRARVDALEKAPRGMTWDGVWADGRSYAQGGAVTHDGSLWVAEMPTRARPGTDNSGWKLIVKRGDVKRDGR